MYSTWVYYSPDRLLFDCGEGISTSLTNKIFAVQKIFLTHGHADHISGLWGFINTRNSAMGEREKPLEIYYPEDSKIIEKYLEFIKSSSNWMKYSLSTYAIDENFKLQLEDGNSRRYIKSFETKHIVNAKTLGYHVMEERKRLKEEFRDLSQNEIRSIVKEKGKDFVTTKYEKKIFTVSGDGRVLSIEEMKDTETLMHECTFLDESDIKGTNHTVLPDLIENVLKAKPKRLIIYHISGRYKNKMRKIMGELNEKLSSNGIELQYVIPGKTKRL